MRGRVRRGGKRWKFEFEDDLFQRKVVNRQIHRAIKESMPHSLPDLEFWWARKDKMVKVLHCMITNWTDRRRKFRLKSFMHDFPSRDLSMDSTEPDGTSMVG